MNRGRVPDLLADLALGDRDMRTWLLAGGAVIWIVGTVAAADTGLPRDIAVAWLVFMVVGEVVFGLGLVMIWRHATGTANKVFELLEQQKTLQLKRNEDVREQSRQETRRMEGEVAGLRVDLTRLQAQGESK